MDSTVYVDSCDPICAHDFRCSWLEWTHRPVYRFPDGAIQTCVGAQVRCQCTFAMWLASFFTYEQPQVVLLAFVFIVLIIALLSLRCIILGLCGGDFMGTPSIKQMRRTLAIPFANNAFLESLDEPNGCNCRISSAQSKPTPSVVDDFPPPYHVIMAEEPPPKYSECV